VKICVNSWLKHFNYVSYILFKQAWRCRASCYNWPS
jgi:hypothetical protein